MLSGHAGDSTPSLLPQTTPNTFTWSFSGAPISINLPNNLIERLQAAISAQETSISEVGGILIGSLGTHPASVDLNGFICIPSWAGSKGTYNLDTNELGRLRKRMGDTETSVIGYFRSQAQGGLELREAELEMVKQYFSDPTNVVLLIQPEHKTAGFFCWCGDFFTPFSFKDFIFDVPSVPSDRAQTESSSLQTAGFEPATILRGTHQNHFVRAVLATAASILMVAFLSRPSAGVATRHMDNPTVSQDGGAPTPLKLEVEALRDGLNVRWNPESTAIKRAVRGYLSILQPDRSNQNMTLSLEDLSRGYVYFRTSAERVEFQMELIDSHDGRERESTLVVFPTIARAHAEPSPLPKTQGRVTIGRVAPDRSMRAHLTAGRNNSSPRSRPGLAASKVAVPADSKPNPVSGGRGAEATVGFVWR